ARVGATAWPGARSEVTWRRIILSAHPRGGGDPVRASEQFIEQIAPARIGSLDQLQLPGAIPFLDLAFANEGVVPGRVKLVPDQAGAAILGGKPSEHLFAVFGRAIDVRVGRGGVERAVSLAGDDVGVEGHGPPHKSSGSPLSRG